MTKTPSRIIMNKLILLLPLFAISFLLSCNNNVDSSKESPLESDDTITPILKITRQDWMKIRFLFEGTIHFTEYYDYIVDDYGFSHVLFGSKQGDKTEPNYHNSKEDLKPTLKYTDFTDGEKVCFAWGERQSYAESMVNDAWKYDKDILTPIVKQKGKIKEMDEMTTTFLTGGTEKTIHTERNNKLYFTSDFMETKVDYSKEYEAYTVSTPGTEKDETVYAMFFVEA